MVLSAIGGTMLVALGVAAHAYRPERQASTWVRWYPPAPPAPPAPAPAVALAPAVPLGDGEVDVGGVKVRYHVRGRGPACLVHPGGPGMSWEYLRMEQLEERLTLIYVEPVGSGASGRLPAAAGYTLARYASDLEAVRKHLGLPRVILLGHSHGGFVAQAYAIAYPGALRGLVLYATTARTDKEWEADVDANIDWFKAEPWFADAKAALAAEGAAKTDADLTALLRREMPLYVSAYTRDRARLDPLIATVQGSLDPIRAPHAPFDHRAKLATLQLPTLVISGRRDFVTSPRFGRELATLIPGARHVEVTDAGHMIHWEKPTLLTTTIARFAASLP
jgi:proline iminopeptidase